MTFDISTMIKYKILINNGKLYFITFISHVLFIVIKFINKKRNSNGIYFPVLESITF